MAQCETCRCYDSRQQKETLMSHTPTDRPWEKIGIDLFSIKGKDYLVLVDYFSNFWEINHLQDTKATTVVRKLKSHFARNGIPDRVISDNGPQFTSVDFQKFSTAWDFEHQTSSPGHQQANGKAEAAVKAAKTILTKARESGNDPYLAILASRNTPTEAMDSSPAQRLLGRRTRTLLPTTNRLLMPTRIDPQKVTRQIKHSQERQSYYYDRNARDLEPLEEGDVVRIKPFTMNKKTWDKATVSRRLDDRSYTVDADNGGTYRRNRVDLRKTKEKPHDNEHQQQLILPQPASPNKLVIPDCPATPPKGQDQHTDQSPASLSSAPSPPTRPIRNRREPAYLRDYVQ